MYVKKRRACGDKPLSVAFHNVESIIYLVWTYLYTQPLKRNLVAILIRVKWPRGKQPPDTAILN